MEIVVALAILSSVLFILLQTHYQGLQLNEQARDTVILHNFLAQAVGQAEVEIVSGSMSGDGTFGARHPDYSYGFEASPLQLGEGNVQIFDVLVYVTLAFLASVYVCQEVYLA